MVGSKEMEGCVSIRILSGDFLVLDPLLKAGTGFIGLPCSSSPDLQAGRAARAERKLKACLERAQCSYFVLILMSIRMPPPPWLADVLARINDLPIIRLGELLPWNWRSP